MTANAETRSFSKWYKSKWGKLSLVYQILLWYFYGFIWIPIHFILEKRAPLFLSWYSFRYGHLRLPFQVLLWLLYGYIWIPIVFLAEKSSYQALHFSDSNAHTDETRQDDSSEYQQQSNTHSDSRTDKEHSSYTRQDESLKKCYQILGIEQGASPSDVKNAYKRKISEYHPDKVSKLGDEIRQLAEEKSKEINTAYQLLKERGAAI